MEILIFDEETKRHVLSQLWESVLPFLTISHHLCRLALFSSWIITYQVDNGELVVSSGDLLTTGLLLSSPSTPLSSFTSFRPVVTKACLHSGLPGEIQKLLIFASRPHLRLRLGFNWSGRSFSVWKLWGLFQGIRCGDQFGNHHLRPLPKPPSFSAHPSVLAAPAPWVNICPWDSTNPFVVLFCFQVWDTMTMFQWNRVSSLFLFSTSILMPNP